MAGLRPSARLLNGLTAVKMLGLFAFVVAAFAVGRGSWSHFVPFAARPAGAPPLCEALGLGLIGAFYSFGGFWEASRVAGEVREPRRTVPRALAIGVAAVTLAYVLTTIAFLYLVPREGAATAPDFARPRGRGAARRLRRRGVRARSSWCRSSRASMALMLMAPRLYLAMSRDGLFPAVLASTHPRTQAPARATALLAAIASVFVLAGSFGQIVALFLCPTLVFIGLAAAAVCSSRAGENARRRPSASRAIRRPRRSSSCSLLAVVALIAVARPLPGSGRIRARSARPARVPASFAAGRWRRDRSSEGRLAMTWIRTIPPAEADEKLREAIESERALYPAEYAAPTERRSTDDEGIVASHSLIPDALFHAFATFGVLMSPDLPLTRRQHEMITTVVSVTNRCLY